MYLRGLFVVGVSRGVVCCRCITRFFVVGVSRGFLL